MHHSKPKQRLMIVWFKLANQHSGQQIQSLVQQVHFSGDHAAISFALRCSFLCDLLLLCLETLVLHFEYRWRTQSHQQTPPMCSAGFGAGRPATATVRAFSGKLHRTATLVAVWFLLLLRWTCEACVILVDRCRHVVLPLEQCACTHPCAVLRFFWYGIRRDGRASRLWASYGDDSGSDCASFHALLDLPASFH